MSDRNSAANSSINRWLLLALGLSLLVIVALGTAWWQLRSQTASASDEDVLEKSDRLAALVEQEQQLQKSSITAPDPFDTLPEALRPGSLFSGPLSAGSLFNDPFFADPFGQMENMRRQMDAFFSQPWGGFSSQGSLGSSANLLSGDDGIAVTDQGDAYEVIVPVAPGAELDLQTNIEDNVLSISGRIVQEAEQSETASGRQLLGRQVSSRQFSRSITLPADVDEAGLVTERQEKQVVITVPKTAT